MLVFSSTCQLTWSGIGSKSASWSQGRSRSPAPMSSLDIRPANDMSRVSRPSMISRPTSGWLPSYTLDGTQGPTGIS